MSQIDETPMSQDERITLMLSIDAAIHTALNTPHFDRQQFQDLINQRRMLNSHLIHTCSETSILCQSCDEENILCMLQFAKNDECECIYFRYDYEDCCDACQDNHNKRNSST